MDYNDPTIVRIVTETLLNLSKSVKNKQLCNIFFIIKKLFGVVFYKLFMGLEVFL